MRCCAEGLLITKRIENKWCTTSWMFKCPCSVISHLKLDPYWLAYSTGIKTSVLATGQQMLQISWAIHSSEMSIGNYWESVKFQLHISQWYKALTTLETSTKCSPMRSQSRPQNRQYQTQLLKRINSRRSHTTKMVYSACKLNRQPLNIILSKLRKKMSSD